MTPDLTTLIERLEKATGPLDNETLGQMICAMIGEEFGKVLTIPGDDGSDELNVYRAGAASCGLLVYSEYRSRYPDVSLDAAIALAERVLPGWYIKITIYENGDGAAHASVGRYVDHELEFYDSLTDAPVKRTAPIAVCLAILRALQAKQGDQP